MPFWMNGISRSFWLIASFEYFPGKIKIFPITQKDRNFPELKELFKKSPLAFGSFNRCLKFEEPQLLHGRPDFVVSVAQTFRDKATRHMSMTQATRVSDLFKNISDKFFVNLLGNSSKF